MKNRFFTTSKGKATWLCRGTAALLVPVLFITAPSNQALANSIPQSTSTTSEPQPAIASKKVTVNRTKPPETTFPSTAVFSANPTDAEIFSKSLFTEPLIPIGGKTSLSQNKALTTALSIFEQRKVRDDFSSLENFLSIYPDSPWRISLLVDLGALYRQTGWYGKAMDTWQAAWVSGQKVNTVDLQSKALIDRALVELLVMNARVGRAETLSNLIKVADSRHLVGSSKERVEEAKQALQLMHSHPETSFRCGPMAVEKIRNMEDGNDHKKWKILSDVSTKDGTSLAQLTKLAEKLSLNMVPAYRTPGSAILVPSVVNWKIGHFAAAIGVEHGLVHLSDPTFNKDVWISEKALDQEASGYCLVKKQTMPAGWRQIDSQEALKVWGKGQVNGSDDTCNSNKDPRTCHGPECLGYGSPEQSSYYQGLWPDTFPFVPAFTPTGENASSSLPTASIHMMLASLFVEDTPIAYTPALGPPVACHFVYSQREAYQPSIFTYSNMGSQWTFNWLSYITDEPAFPGQPVTQYLSDGGTLSYSGYVSSTSSYAPEAHTGGVLKITGPASYEIDMPDGSKQIFSAANTANPRKIFLTLSIDALGHGLTFSYDGNFRITAITDALGQVTTISYTSLQSIYLITKITDPFNRSATFTYNSVGSLQSCTNMNGVVSTFAYNGGLLQSFTTPYGTTSFDLGQDTLKRWGQITDPQGGNERIETWLDATGVAPSLPNGQNPYGTDNTYTQYRNTFYWDKKAMMDAPGQYAKAQRVHWLEDTGTPPVMTGQIEFYQAPLEYPVYYLYPGQVASYSLGTSGLPSTKERIVDSSGATDLQSTQYTYSATGKPQQVNGPKVTNPYGLTSNSTGRITINNYDSGNGIDLLNTKQQNASGQDTVFSATYNSTHEPLTTTDSAGQTTTYTYDPTTHQLTSVQDPSGQKKLYAYTAGFLTSITDSGTGTVLASFTPDSLGRVATSTDVNGYTLTYGYDNLDRVTTTTYPDGTFEQNVYATLDLSLHKDRLNRWTQYFYNSVSQLVAVEDPQGRVTSYDRCACGELKSMTDPYGHRTSWNNDLEGRLVTKTFPDGSTYNYTYEPASGRLSTFQDAKSQTTSYSYDVDDTIFSLTYSGGTVATPAVYYTYDPYYPRLTQLMQGGTVTGGVPQGGAATGYTYYPAGVLGGGLVKTDTSPIPNSAITYTYDVLGRATTTAIGASTVTLTFDALNRLHSETDSALSSTAFGYAYYGNTPRLQTVTYPNGQSTSYTYQTGSTQDFRLTDLTNYKTGSTVLSKFDYTYNANGTIATWQQQTDGNSPTTWNYQYDQADQLLSAIKNNSTGGQLAQYVYGYDLAGNRVSRQVGLNVTTTAYNDFVNEVSGWSGGGQLQFSGTLSKPAQVTIGGNPALVNAANNSFSGTANVTAGMTNIVSVIANDYDGNSSTNKYQVVVPANSSVTPGYDTNGNLTSNGLGQAYEWDEKDELTAINYSGAAVMNGITRTQFTYDGNSRRVAIVEKQGTTVYSTKQFVWVGDRMAEERDGSGNVTKRFFGLGEQVGATPYYLTRDHLGSVREMSDATGTVQARYDYDPYGAAPLGSTTNLIFGTNLSDFQYAGMYQHATSLLNLTKYRAYDPNSGRWLSRDPIGENGGINLYGYAFNDPVDLTDLLGLDPQGHHYVPRSIWKNLSDEVKKVWDDSQNRLDAKGYKAHDFKDYKGVKCKDYGKAVADKLKDFLKSLDKESPNDLNETQLQEFADEIKNADGEIGAYNAGVAEEITATTDAAVTATETVEVLEVVGAVDETVIVVGTVVK